MKRKVIAITLTAMMAAGMLAGCGSSDSSSSLAADTTKEASTTEADGSTAGDSTAAGGDFSGQISVISREDGSGTRGAFIELFGVEEKNDAGEKVDNTTVDAQITNNTSVMMSTVAGNQYAIGYISLGSLNDEVKALKIDGAEASAENVENGSYKVSRPFNIVTKDGLSADAQDFAMTACTPSAFKTPGACSLEEPQPKFSPPTTKSPGFTFFAKSGSNDSNA